MRTNTEVKIHTWRMDIVFEYASPETQFREVYTYVYTHVYTYISTYTKHTHPGGRATIFQFSFSCKFVA